MAEKSILDLVKNIDKMNLSGANPPGGADPGPPYISHYLKKRRGRKILEDADRLMNSDAMAWDAMNAIIEGDNVDLTEDIEPLGALNYNDPLSRKYNITSVESAQRLLSEAGYDLGPTKVDGKYGPFTEKAWMDFAKDQASYWKMAPKMYGKKPGMSDLLDHLITKNAIRSQRKQ